MTSLYNELISEQSEDHENNRESWEMNEPGVRGLGEGLAESIGVEAAMEMDREGVLVITNSLSWLITETRLFSLLDRFFCNTEPWFS